MRGKTIYYMIGIEGKHPFYYLIPINSLLKREDAKKEIIKICFDTFSNITEKDIIIFDHYSAKQAEAMRYDIIGL